MKHRIKTLVAAAAIATIALHAEADVITDWSIKSGEIITEAKIGTPPAVRVMAIVQTAADGAVQAAGRRPAANAASVDAAVAAAHRVTLSKLLPAQQALIDAAYQAALAPLPEGAAKAAGIAAGEEAASAVLAARGEDGATAAEAYRPHAAAGAYVPTAVPAVPQWPQRKPWLMSSPAQFRPGPPPALGSDVWTRDFNEVKALGGKVSAARSTEQTEMARFWEYSLPAIYHGVLRSVALAPGRDVARNARLFAAAAQAMDDTLMSVFDAKYHYNFWRPLTAIRNADIDGNEATTRDAAWLPLIDTPMHPEYPSAHAGIASAVATLIKAEIGSGAMPVLSTSSPTAKGAVRRWNTLEAFVQEVSLARIYDGVHYRTSCDAGAEMGKRVGDLVAARMLREGM